MTLSHKVCCDPREKQFKIRDVMFSPTLYQIIKNQTHATTNQKLCNIAYTFNYSLGYGGPLLSFNCSNK